MFAMLADIPVSDTGEIGKQLALVAAVAAAMQVFLGPTIHAQVEALQASGLIPARFGGVAAIVLGALFGMGLGALGIAATTGHGWALLVVGLLGGILAGTGAILTDERIDGLAAAKQEKEAARAEAAELAAPVPRTQPLFGNGASGADVVTHVGLPRDP